MGPVEIKWRGGTELVVEGSDGCRPACGWQRSEIGLQPAEYQRAAARVNRGQPAQRGLPRGHRPVQVAGRDVRPG